MIAIFSGRNENKKPTNKQKTIWRQSGIVTMTRNAELIQRACARAFSPSQFSRKTSGRKQKRQTCSAECPKSVHVSEFPQTAMHFVLQRLKHTSTAILISFHGISHRWFFVLRWWLGRRNRKLIHWTTFHRLNRRGLFWFWFSVRLSDWCVLSIADVGSGDEDESNGKTVFDWLVVVTADGRIFHYVLAT